jgi:sensor c-di-GMP phosphodiesterase-like protein
MARSLKVKVVAEGVENSAQMNFLASRHCDEVQGYYLAVPMAAEELSKGYITMLKRISAESTRKQSDTTVAIKGGESYGKVNSAC